MIDDVFKPQMDRLWDRVGAVFVRLGISPNAVTLASLVLVVINAALLPWHGNLFAFGVALALFELLDNVDGAIARVGNQTTKAGAFLDATTDRIKESAALIAVAQVTGAWLAASLALAGGMMVSYNLARAIAEGARPKMRIPPLFERMERIVTLCAGCILAGSMPDFAGVPFVVWSLWLLALGSGVTALQRLRAGFVALRAMSASDGD